MTPINLHDFEGRHLPGIGAVCFMSLDGSDVAAWLKAQGYEVLACWDAGTNGVAITRDGWQLSTNGYVSHVLRDHGTATYARHMVDTVDLDDALIWDLQPEKWIHCADLLGISERSDGADFVEYWIDRLEERFQALLDASATS